MAGKTIIKLGDVFMPYSRFQWPKYRGVIARPVEMDCPAEFYVPLVALAKSVRGRTTTLTVTGPSNPGANPGDASVTIEGVYIDRVIQVSDALTRVVLYDRRLLLSRYICPRDFNIRFGDKDASGKIKYLAETEFPKYQAAILEVLESRADVGANFDAFVNPESFNAADGLHLSGLTMAQALSDLLDRYGASLTVWNNGGMYVVELGDATQVGQLPGKSTYSWDQEPGWIYNAAYVCGRPSVIKCYYKERHCMRLQGAGGDISVAHAAPQALRVELEQVYKSKDAEGKAVFYTLAELLTAYGFSTGDLTEAQIAQRFMSENFEGTGIYSQLENEAMKAVANAVHESWRTLWRVKYVGTGGAVGGWTDWAFGKLNSDGSVSPVSVECEWVEFLNVISPDVGNGSKFIGSVTTVNHPSTVPAFTAAWEGDASSGIVRIEQKQLRDNNRAIPGALTEPLKIVATQKVEDGQGNGYTIDGYEFVEEQDESKAEFEANFTITIYICATRRMPNTESRFHVERVSAFTDGDVDFIELPVSEEVTCFRDYVNANEGKGALSDGLGLVMNAAPLTDDAIARAEVWKARFATGVESSGVAESLMAFRDLEVKGPVSEIVLDVDGEVVKTRIVTGNLADDNAQRRREVKRLAERRFKTAGAI